MCETGLVPDPSGKKSNAPPLVTFREESAGRETLSAIFSAGIEPLGALGPRSPAPTQIYGDRISNAPGAVSPKTARALDDAPELTLSYLPAGRATRAAIEHEFEDDGPTIEVHDDETELALVEQYEERSPQSLAVDKIAIEQQHAFIVRVPSADLKAPHVRNRLMKERLLPAVPGASLNDVTKLVVEAHGEEASLVRFWTRLP